MKPKPKLKWNSKSAAISQARRRRSKHLLGPLQFKTRKHGTSKQIGQVFPVGGKKQLPKIEGHKFDWNKVKAFGKGIKSGVEKADKFADRVSKKIESGAEKLGQIESFQSSVSAAYEKGRRPQDYELRNLRKQIEIAQANARLRRFKAPGAEQSYSFEDNRDRIDWLIQSKENGLRAAKLGGNNEEVREIQRDLQELRILSRRAIGGSPNTQEYVSRRIFSMGGKCSKHKVTFMANGKRVSFLAAGGKQETAPSATKGDNVMASMPSRRGQ